MGYKIMAAAEKLLNINGRSYSIGLLRWLNRNKSIELTGDWQIIQRHTRESWIDGTAFIPPCNWVLNLFYISSEIVSEFIAEAWRFGLGERWQIIEYVHVFFLMRRRKLSSFSLVVNGSLTFPLDVLPFAFALPFSLACSLAFGMTRSAYERS